MLNPPSPSNGLYGIANGLTFLAVLQGLAIVLGLFLANSVDDSTGRTGVTLIVGGVLGLVLFSSGAAALRAIERIEAKVDAMQRVTTEVVSQDRRKRANDAATRELQQEADALDLPVPPQQRSSQRPKPAA